jgi:hypothetical protein
MLYSAWKTFRIENTHNCTLRWTQYYTSCLHINSL